MNMSICAYARLYTEACRQIIDPLRKAPWAPFFRSRSVLSNISPYIKQPLYALHAVRLCERDTTICTRTRICRRMFVAFFPRHVLVCTQVWMKTRARVYLCVCMRVCAGCVPVCWCCVRVHVDGPQKKIHIHTTRLVHMHTLVPDPGQL